MRKEMFKDKYGLTKAVLQRLKTMTRRIAKPATEKEISFCNIKKDWYEDENGDVYIPKYSIGEVVAIAQPYSDFLTATKPGTHGHYRINGKWYSDKELQAGWNNKMFVKAGLMPHHIKITAINIEHLQDISEEDCEKEGIACYGLKYDHYGDPEYVFEGSSVYTSARDAFSVLIDKVCGKGTWERNPLVWVYEFELMDEPLN